MYQNFRTGSKTAGKHKPDDPWGTPAWTPVSQGESAKCMYCQTEIRADGGWKDVNGSTSCPGTTASKTATKCSDCGQQIYQDGEGGAWHKGGADGPTECPRGGTHTPKQSSRKTAEGDAAGLVYPPDDMNDGNAGLADPSAPATLDPAATNPYAVPMTPTPNQVTPGVNPYAAAYTAPNPSDFADKSVAWQEGYRDGLWEGSVSAAGNKGRGGGFVGQDGRDYEEGHAFGISETKKERASRAAAKTATPGGVLLGIGVGGPQDYCLACGQSISGWEAFVPNVHATDRGGLDRWCGLDAQRSGAMIQDYDRGGFVYTPENATVASKEAASESTAMECLECGHNFKKKLTPSTVEVKCPKCSGYDTYPADEPFTASRRPFVANDGGYDESYYQHMADEQNERLAERVADEAASYENPTIDDIDEAYTYVVSQSAGDPGDETISPADWLSDEEETQIKARARELFPQYLGSKKTAMKLMTKELESQIPKLYSTENTPLDDNMFGFVTTTGDVNDPFAEWGYVSLREMENVEVLGLGMERDLYFTPVKWSEIKANPVKHGSKTAEFPPKENDEKEEPKEEKSEDSSSVPEELSEEEAKGDPADSNENPFADGGSAAPAEGGGEATTTKPRGGGAQESAPAEGEEAPAEEKEAPAEEGEAEEEKKEENPFKESLFRTASPQAWFAKDPEYGPGPTNKWNDAPSGWYTTGESEEFYSGPWDSEAAAQAYIDSEDNTAWGDYRDSYIVHKD
jgi:hypothetical protein